MSTAPRKSQANLSMILDMQIETNVANSIQDRLLKVMETEEPLETLISNEDCSIEKKEKRKRATKINFELNEE